MTYLSSEIAIGGPFPGTPTFRNWTGIYIVATDLETYSPDFYFYKEDNVTTVREMP